MDEIRAGGGECGVKVRVHVVALPGTGLPPTKFLIYFSRAVQKLCFLQPPGLIVIMCLPICCTMAVGHKCKAHLPRCSPKLPNQLPPWCVCVRVCV